MQDEVYSLKLSRNTIGQILDGLEVLAEQWSETATYLAKGYCKEDSVIRECSNFQEACNIRNTYQSILKEIYCQLKTQTE